MTFDGRQRSYRLFVPAKADRRLPLPLVLVMHGTNDSGAIIEQFSGYDAVAATHGFVVAYPDAAYGAWNAAFRPSVRKDIGPADDEGFLVQLVNEIAATTPIDRRRVYATGHSSGARMAYRLGCERPDVFAAIAPVAGGLHVSCMPRRPVPVIHVTGAADPQTLRESEGSVLPMLKADGCPSRPTVSRSGRAHIWRYGPCRGNSEYVYIAIAGWGHAWAGNLVFDTTGESWRFLSRFSLPAA